MLNHPNSKELNLKKIEEEKTEEQLNKGFNNIVLELEGLVGKLTNDLKTEEPKRPYSPSLLCSMSLGPSMHPKKPESPNSFKEAILRGKAYKK